MIQRDLIANFIPASLPVLASAVILPCVSSYSIWLQLRASTIFHFSPHSLLYDSPFKSLKSYTTLRVGNFLRKTGRPEAVGRADRKIRFVCVSVIEGLTKICVPSEPSQASGRPPKPPGINMSLLRRGVTDMSSVTSPPRDTEQTPRPRCALMRGATNQSTEKK